MLVSSVRLPPTMRRKPYATTNRKNGKRKTILFLFVHSPHIPTAHAKGATNKSSKQQMTRALSKDKTLPKPTSDDAVFLLAAYFFLQNQKTGLNRQIEEFPSQFLERCSIPDNFLKFVLLSATQERPHKPREESNPSIFRFSLLSYRRRIGK